LNVRRPLRSPRIGPASTGQLRRSFERGAYILTQGFSRAHPCPPTHSQVEARLRQLEGRAVNKSASLAKAAAVGSKGTPKAYDAQRGGATPALLVTPKSYNADADAPKSKKKDAAAAAGEGAEDDAARAARKAAKKAAKAAAAAAGDGQGEDEEAPRPKKKKVAA